VFQSTVATYVGSDTNGVSDVFVRDRDAGTTARVSITSGGAQANGASDTPSISADGRYVAFTSVATNLVSGDTNSARDIFVRDLSASTTTRVSVSSSGVQANGKSDWPRQAGAYTVFESSATNLVSGDTNGVTDVFIRNGVANSTARVSVATSGTQGNGISLFPAVTPDGNYVVFSSKATNFVTDTNGTDDVFIRNRTAGTTTRVSVSSSGAQANGSSLVPSISDDGRWVGFQSSASGLVSGDTNAATDAFVRDRTTNTTTRVSLTSSGVQGNAGSSAPWVSGDGRKVVFYADASNLVSGDTNGVADIFVRDRALGKTERASVTPSGGEGQGLVGYYPHISADGRFPVFDTTAKLVVADLNSTPDAYIRDLGPGEASTTIPREQTYGLSSVHATDPSGMQSDPVNSATGSFTTQVTDAKLAGIGRPFEFSRSYNSLDGGWTDMGQGWTHTFSAALTIQGNGDVRLRAEDGQQAMFIKQPDGSFVGAPGVRSTLALVAGKYELTRHDQAVDVFDSAGKLLELRDRNGNKQTLTYDPSNRLLKVTDTAGRVVDFTHNDIGVLTKIALPDGRAVNFTYTPGGRLSSVQDLRGGITTYTYTPAQLTKIVDQNGHTVVENVYGADGRVIEQTDALGKKSTFSWDSATQTSVMTDPRGNKWTDIYYNNALVKRIDPLGNTTTYGYDTDLNAATITDPRGNTTTMTYDDRGNLLKRVAPAPLNYEEVFTYDSRNNLLTAEDPRGNTTTFTYDIQGNLTSIEDAASATTSFAYDTKGLMTSATDARDKTTTFTYDTSGNRTETSTPLGYRTTMGYDSAGRMTSRVDPRGNVAGADPGPFTWTYTYDAADNLQTVTDPLGNATSHTYDAAGQRSALTEDDVQVAAYAYSDRGELTSVTAADGSVTSYTHDAARNLVTRTDANNHTTTYAYDAASRLTDVTSPTSQHWRYEYDPAGNRVEYTNARGQVLTSSYDEINRLEALDYSDPSTPDVTFSYDAAGNRTQMTDGAGSETYSYDAVNRLSSVTRGTSTFAYQYDPTGNVTQRTYPGADPIAYGFDDDGRLATVTDTGGTTAFTYDAAVNLTTKVLPVSNGYTEMRSYDLAGRLLEVRHEKSGNTLAFAQYTRDRRGNPTEVVTQVGTTTYSYDERSRITSACLAPCGPANAIAYEYDGVGNRTAETREAGTTTYEYSAADQLTSTSGLNGPTSYEYDADGNETGSGQSTFAYDQANRMLTASVGNVAQSYSYDGEGKRVTVSGSNAVRFDWDRNHAVPLLTEELEPSGSFLRRYTYGNGLLSMTTGTTSHYYHGDGTGSVAALTGANGDAEWSYTYEPFGATNSADQLDPTAPNNPMRFTSQYLDSTEIYHLRARQYDSNVGRFLSLDPVVDRADNALVASYVYVNNRPTVLVDPSGAFCLFGGEPGGACRGASVVRVSLRVGSVILGVASIVAAPFTAGGSLAWLPVAFSLASIGAIATAEGLTPGPCRSDRVVYQIGLGVVGGAIAGGVGESWRYAALGTSAGIFAGSFLPITCTGTSQLATNTK
jgi:RHS repeat-associated protein